MWKQAVDDLAASGADVTWKPEATCWMIHLQSICLTINDANIDFSTQRQQNKNVQRSLSFPFKSGDQACFCISMESS